MHHQALSKSISMVPGDRSVTWDPTMPTQHADNSAIPAHSTMQQQMASMCCVEYYCNYIWQNPQIILQPSLIIRGGLLALKDVLSISRLKLICEGSTKTIFKEYATFSSYTFQLHFVQFHSIIQGQIHGEVANPPFILNTHFTVLYQIREVGSCMQSHMDAAG